MPLRPEIYGPLRIHISVKSTPIFTPRVVGFSVAFAAAHGFLPSEFISVYVASPKKVSLYIVLTSIIYAGYVIFRSCGWVYTIRTESPPASLFNRGRASPRT